MLDMAAQQGFNVLFGIVGDLLELVETDDARLVGLLQSLEDFLKREFGIMHIAERKTEGGHSRQGVETEVGTERLQRLHKPKRHLLAFVFQGTKYLTAKSVGELAKTCGVKDVDVEAVIIGAKRFLVVAKLDEFRLAHTSRRHEANILAVGEHLDEFLALFFPVAEVFRRNIAVDDEWIRNHNVLILRQRYENYLNHIIKLCILYYTNCIIF